VREEEEEVRSTKYEVRSTERGAGRGAWLVIVAQPAGRAGDPEPNRRVAGCSPGGVDDSRWTARDGHADDGRGLLPVGPTDVVGHLPGRDGVTHPGVGNVSLRRRAGRSPLAARLSGGGLRRRGAAARAQPPGGHRHDDPARADRQRLGAVRQAGEPRCAPAQPVGRPRAAGPRSGSPRARARRFTPDDRRVRRAVAGDQRRMGLRRLQCASQSTSTTKSMQPSAVSCADVARTLSVLRTLYFVLRTFRQGRRSPTTQRFASVRRKSWPSETATELRQ